MSGRRGSGSGRLQITGWLRIDCGHRVKGGRWVRYPAADYWCGRCGWTASASGDGVQPFATAVRDRHAQACTAWKAVPA